MQNKAAWAVLAMLMACGDSGRGLQDGTNPPPQAPQAHLTISAARVAPGDTLTADASLSTGTGRLTYTFDWGDGDSSSGSKPVATHVYAARGAFTVKLTVLDSRGSAMATAPVAVWSDVAPVVRLSWSSGVMPNEPVIVDASASTAVNGRIVSYAFAVVYGETRVQATPIATFAFGQPGTYAINVTVTDEAGESATAGGLVIVGLKVAPKLRVPTEPASLFRTAAHFARDTAGTLYAIWFDAGGLAFSRSTDDGRTFEPQTTIVATGGPFQVAPLGSALAVSDGGVVHIAWTWDEGDFGYVRSLDGGATFTPLALFDPVGGFVSYSPSIAVSGEDRVTVSWVQAAPGPTLPASSPVASSSSGGQTYALMSQLPAPDFTNCNTSLAYDGSTLIAAWHGVTDATGGAQPSSIVQVATSTDFGATFSVPLTLDAELNTFCPNVVAQHGHIAVFWVAGNIAENQRLMFSVSADGGTTWSLPISASPSYAKAVCGNATFDGAGNLYVAYSEAGAGQIQHRIRASSDGGRTFGPDLAPTLVLDGGDCLALNAAAPGLLDLVWSEPRLDGTGLFEVYYASATMSLP